MTDETPHFRMEYGLTIDHMCCEHCETTITDAVDEVDGITAVDADSETNTVTVTGTEDTEPQIRDAIEDAGFTITN